jgi:anti-anti-sigma factor
VDLSNAETLASALEPWLEASGDITLDMEAVVFMDSTGIGILMHTAKTLGSRGNLRLVSPGPLVYNVLKLIAADTLPNVEILTPRGGVDESPAGGVDESPGRKDGTG